MLIAKRSWVLRCHQLGGVRLYRVNSSAEFVSEVLLGARRSWTLRCQLGGVGLCCVKAQRTLTLRCYELGGVGLSVVNNWRVGLFCRFTATTRHFYELKIYKLPQNMQILCRLFTIEQHWTVFSRETRTNWRRTHGNYCLPTNVMSEGLSFPLVPGLIVGTFLVSLLPGDANHLVWQGLGCASAGIKP